jgi:hypothetical protein
MNKIIPYESTIEFVKRNAEKFKAALLHKSFLLYMKGSKLNPLDTIATILFGNKTVFSNVSSYTRNSFLI